MPNYENGLIYKLKSVKSSKCYIGSTIQSLIKRFYKHKGDYKQWIQGKGGYMTSYEIMKLDDIEIELLELFPCKSLKELHTREKFHILNNICVNKVIPTRTDIEYYEENKEIILEKQRQRYHDNIEHEHSRQKVYYNNNKCAIKVKRDKWYEHNKTYNSEYYQNNKDSINERQYTKVQCECGLFSQIGNLRRHKQSKRHIERIQNI